MSWRTSSISLLLFICAQMLFSTATTRLWYTEDPQRNFTTTLDFSTGPFHDRVDASPNDRDDVLVYSFGVPLKPIERLINYFKILQPVLTSRPPAGWARLPFDELRELVLEHSSNDELLRELREEVIIVKRSAHLCKLYPLKGQAGAREIGTWLLRVPETNDSSGWQRRHHGLMALRVADRVQEYEGELICASRAKCERR